MSEGVRATMRGIMVERIARHKWSLISGVTTAVTENENGFESHFFNRSAEKSPRAFRLPGAMGLLVLNKIDLPT